MSRDYDCCHRHKFSGETSCDFGHEHDFKGKTTYAPNCVPHIHYVECCTSKEDGHRHCVMIPTSREITCPDGSHFHYINGQTECECGHIHCINECTSEE